MLVQLTGGGPKDGDIIDVTWPEPATEYGYPPRVNIPTMNHQILSVKWENGEENKVFRSHVYMLDRETEDIPVYTYVGVT